MRRLLTLLATYAGILFLAPPLFAVFRLAGEQFISSQVLAAHPWLLQVITYTPILLLLLIFLKATLRPAADYGFVYTEKWLWVSVAIGVVSAVCLYALDMYSGFFSTHNIHTNPSLLVAAGYLFSWALLGPFVEEFFFRGFIQTTVQEALTSKYAVHVAVGVAVIFEVLFHAVFGSELLQLSYVAVFGLAAGIVYARTNSLLGPFLIHAIGNGGELLLFWLLV